MSKYTGVVTRSGAGTERVTRQCHLVHSSHQEDDIWVDTMVIISRKTQNFTNFLSSKKHGWDDAEVEDEETFKNILRFISKNDILRVSCVIWNILPNIRKDALLRKQAQMINLFKAEEIWRNVIIVAKQSLNPEEDCAGAVRERFKVKKILFQNAGGRGYR